MEKQERRFRLWVWGMTTAISMVSALMLFPIKNLATAQTVTQPFEHSYNIVVKEKFIVHDGVFLNYVVRYYNETMGKSYLSSVATDDNTFFIEFDLEERLVMWEKHDGVNYQLKFLKQSDYKAEK